MKCSDPQSWFAIDAFDMRHEYVSVVEPPPPSIRFLRKYTRCVRLRLQAYPAGEMLKHHPIPEKCTCNMWIVKDINHSRIARECPAPPDLLSRTAIFPRTVDGICAVAITDF